MDTDGICMSQPSDHMGEYRRGLGACGEYRNVRQAKTEKEARQPAWREAGQAAGQEAGPQAGQEAGPLAGQEAGPQAGQGTRPDAAEQGNQLTEALPAVQERIREIREALPEMAEQAGLIRETGKNVAELLSGVKALGEMVRIMGERMSAMEQTIRTLEKVTPGQAAEINRRIRERAAEICREYGMDTEARKPIVAGIRRDVREMTGVRTAREIARCDRETVTEFIGTWEDYDAIQRIRRRTGK